MIAPARRSTVRLAELVATLSLGTDLGLGQPMDHVIRGCLIALRLSERLGFSESERVVVYYSALLAWVGCHTDAYEQAKWFGDDIALKADARLVDGGNLGTLVSHIGAGKPLIERIRLGVAFLGDGRRAMLSMLHNHWLATLTAREVEVLRLLARGLSNKEIAQYLGISRKTAGNHVEHIFPKIGDSNRARAGLFASTHGLMGDILPLDDA